MLNFYKVVLLLAHFPTWSFAVENSQNVGHVEEMGNMAFVTGQNKFPYVVHITINTFRYGKKDTNWCTGIIIGIKAVLTAAHCLHNKNKPTVTVHAGIVDTKWERNAGQKVFSTQYTLHKGFSRECNVGKRCCHAVNDLAILWLQTEFVFGAYVKKAILNEDPDKPIDKDGWILGWGLTKNGEIPTMLQKGLVKTVNTQTCEKHNPRLYVTQNVICLTGVDKNTKSGSGDSGGPFVIDGVVYGMSSFAAKSGCHTTSLDVYTYVAKYIGWIDNVLREGPPNASTTPKPKGHKKKP